jgi:hypothetical protein
MKTQFFAAIFFLVLLFSSISIASAAPPQFAAPVKLQANGQDINVGYGGNASPFMVDWDGDSKQDLLLGQYDGGKVRFYKNTGAHYAPEFGNFVYLQADGSDIQVSYG